MTIGAGAAGLQRKTEGTKRKVDRFSSIPLTCRLLVPEIWQDRKALLWRFSGSAQYLTRRYISVNTASLFIFCNYISHVHPS